MRNRGLLIKSITFMLISLVVLSCQKETERKVKAPDGFVIKIGDKVVTVLEFEEMFALNYPQITRQKGDDYYINPLKVAYLYELAEEMILNEIAQKSGITVNDVEIFKEIESIKESYTENSFNEMLDLQSMNLGDLQETIRKRLVIKRVLDEKVYSEIKINDDEIKAYYKMFKNSFHKPEEFKIEQITFHDEAKAKDILGKIKSGEMDFESAVKDYSSSQDDFGADGTGYVPKSGLPEEFEAALESMKPGVVSGIINTAFGYHILKLIDKHDERTPSFDEVKEEIDRVLREKKEKNAYDKFMSNYKKEKKVIIDDKLFTTKAGNK